MVELVMRKRRAQAGEIGLFVESPVFEEEMASIKMDSEVKVVATTPRSLKQHKFIWALATKVAEACDFLETKDDAYNYMLIEAKHARYIYDNRREISYAIPKATNWGAMDGSSFTKLVKRITHIVGTHIVPGIDQLELKAEIEKMLNPDLIPTMGDEPPPITEIPDGPGMGHNSGPAGLSTDQTAHDQAVLARQNHERQGQRSPNAPDSPYTPASRTPPPEPSLPVLRPSPGGTVRTVDEGGNPDWSKDVPGDQGSYFAYARFHIERRGDMGLAMGWLLGDQQTALRTEIGVPYGVRKQLERHAAEHYGVKQ